MNKRIYLDNNASTPVDPAVIAALTDALLCFGNASSLHEEGRTAKAILNRSRALIAEKIGAKSSEIVFTSCGTESMETLILGSFKEDFRGHVISSAVEHACVLETLKRLEAKGVAVSYLKPGTYGAITAEQVENEIRPDTRLIALMAANNETGVITPYPQIAAMAHRHRIPFVVDAVCAFGKAPFTVVEGITGAGFSAHKFHAPKGTGFFYLQAKAPFSPLIVGGEQEQGRRGGSVAVPLIAAMAKAVELLTPDSMQAMEQMRHRFETLLKDALPDAEVNGTGPRIANTSNFYFPGVEGEMLLQKLDLAGVSCSHGSACSSGALEPSKVLLGMDYGKERAGSSLRFSLSRMNTREEIEDAVKRIVVAVKALR
jgi:cysteine desulfurase